MSERTAFMTRLASHVRHIVAALLLAPLSPAFAAEPDDRLLTRIDAYRTDERIDLVIGLTGGYRYVSHALEPSGALLQVHLRPDAAANGGATEGVSSLRWMQTREIPLDLVSSEISGAIPSVVVRFTGPVRVIKVDASPDDRTLTVSIASVEAKPPRPPPSVAAASLERDSGVFVVNLGSSATATPVSGSVALPGEHAYQVRSRLNDVVRYRQRLGFFSSSEMARSRLAQVAAAFPGAWVSEITPLERDTALSAGGLVDLAGIEVRAQSDAKLPAITLERLEELMENARAAAAGSDLTRAATLYERIAAYPVSPYQQDASELLGAVREKAGQAALAKAAYEAYLQQFPDGSGADRVRQRLTALVAPPSRMSPRVEGARLRTAGADWDVFGSVFQFYSYDQFQINNEDVRTTRSLLSSDLDVNARRRSDALDLRMRLAGSYDHDFLDNAESEFRASMAYVDLASRSQVHTVRAGRQTRTSGGALGRFDGMYYGLRLGAPFRVNLIGGAPVFSTADGVDGDRLLYGLSFDIGPIAEAWNLTLYGIQQTVDSLVDRRAVGSELRFYRGGLSLFGLFDYDLQFGEPNIAYLIASGTFGDTTTLSLIADRRRSPLLLTSNALIGQMDATIAGLQQTYSDEEIEQLALDRTATSTSYTASLSQAIDERFRISADITSSALSSMPASAGVEALPEMGPDWYYNLQLIGTDVFTDQDLGVLGMRYTDADSYSGISGSLNYRLRTAMHVDLNPRLRIDRRRTTAGRTQWIYAPSLRTVWTPRRDWTLELELAAELSNQEFADTTDKSKLYFVYLGYRYDF